MSAQRWLNARDVYWLPWSLWWMTPLGRRRTTARYRLHSHVGTDVMSAIHRRFGSCTTNRRFTRSGGWPIALALLGRAERPAPTHADQPARAHQPGDSLAANGLTGLLKIEVNPRHAVRTHGVLVRLLDLLHQDGITLRPRSLWTFQPRVVAAFRDLKQPTHHPHRVARLDRLHELESRGGIELASRANQAAAFPRISRSSSSCLTLHRSRVSFGPLLRR